MGYLMIIFSTTVVYLFIVIAMRIVGKTEIAQLSITDLVFIMLLSNAMVGANTSLLGGLVAAATLFIVNMIFKHWMYRIPWFSKMLEGDALLLVYEGKVNDANLQKSKITTNDLLEAIREHGLADVAEVKMAVLEVDGNISVIAGDKR